jgi:hypothetical protein
VSGTEKSAFFQQVAVNAEAVSNDWNFNTYALIPVGDTEQKINWFYSAGSLATYGLDVGYFITPVVNASVGYYYQDGDGTEADSSGVLGRVAYEISSGLTAGVNLSYDEAFETRVSADIKVRFGGASTTAQRKEVQQLPVISALTSTPSNRDVRVHDAVSNAYNDWVESCVATADSMGNGAIVNITKKGCGLSTRGYKMLSGRVRVVNSCSTEKICEKIRKRFGSSTISGM